MEWFTAPELADFSLVGMPNTRQGMLSILKKLVKPCHDKSRQREGSKATEYHISILPPVAQAALLRKAGKVKVGGMTLDLPKDEPQARYCKEVIWDRWNKANFKAKEKAKTKVAALQAVMALHRNGVKLMTAYDHIAAEYGVAAVSIRRDAKAVKGFDECDWLAVLVPQHQAAATGGRKRRLAKITPQAWDFFKADYLRREKPNASKCYERLVYAAREQDWVIPSLDSLKRRLNLEIPFPQQVMMREGEHALMQLYPPQERTVSDLEAMQWINADGYQHNVFVRWFNGETLRPKTWFWQDIYSRKIIGWRCDISENADAIRLSLMDVCSQYGLPREITIDNTRAAASKKMTAGIPNRYRFAVKEDDPDGIIKLLGIEHHWTSVQYGKGHGQAKPIERAFGVGGLEEYIDKDLTMGGAYTGSSPMDKPDNYGERVIEVNDFLAAVARGVEMFNAKQNRNTEACRGVMSFDQAFAASYEKAVVRKATPEQLQLLMLEAESVRISRFGTFVLMSGGTISNRKNRYHHKALFDHVGKKVVVRFDPQKLHETVVVYTNNGQVICTAECIEKVAFGDTQQAREHKRKRTQFTKANKAAAKAQQGMSVLEAAALLPAVESPTPPETKVVEMVRPVALGNAALAVQPAPLAASQPQTEPAPVVDYEARYIAANELALATLKKSRI